MNRFIPFDAIENARELGGLPAAGGRTVRQGLLLRTGNLSRATDADAERLLREFNLTEVVDFRFPAEAAKDPDRVLPGVRYTALSTLPQRMIDGFSQGRVGDEQPTNVQFAAMLVHYAMDPRAQELARQLSYSRTLLRRSILFVGFGASEETFAGSWYFLNRSFASDAANIDAMVNLDMLGTKGAPLYAYTASNEDLNTVINTLTGELLPVQAQLINYAPYPGDQIAFYDKEIPSVLFTTGRYPEHDTGRDTYDLVDFYSMEKSLEYIYSYVQHLANGQRPLFRNDGARPSKESPSGTVYSYNEVDVKPTFLNSSDPSVFLERWVYQYLKYPKYAVENGIQGRVLVDFVVDEKGQVRDVKVVRGVHTSLDDEAVRVIAASPKWKAGRRLKKAVKVEMTVAVDFRLEKGKDGKFGINGVNIKK